MRRKIQLAVVAAALAVVSVAPARASAAEICNAGDPLLDKVVCGTYGLVGAVVCKVTKGQTCIT